MSEASNSQQSPAQLVAEQLKLAVARGELGPGDRLVELDLAERLQVSRGRVREAVRMLAAEGIAVLRKNRSAVIATPTIDDVAEVYALRRAIGAIAIEHCVNASLFDERQAEVVSLLLARLRDPKVQADRMRMVDADLAFQSALIRAGSLPRVSELFEQSGMEVRLFVQLLNTQYDPSNHAALIERHTQLAHLIAAGALKEALELWDTHMRITIREFAAVFPASDNASGDTPLIEHLFSTGKG
jgi:DNA-binding GntR family transcriptional regulator